jgi:hypothetical protein
MSAEHGHHSPEPPKPMTTPEGRQLFPNFMPPHIRAMSDDRRTDLFGAPDRFFRTDSPVSLGLPSSGSGHHPEQNRAERLAGINTPSIKRTVLDGLREEDVVDVLLAVQDERTGADERLKNYNPRVFLGFRQWVTQKALGVEIGRLSTGVSDYLTTVHMAHTVQYGENEQVESSPAAVKRHLLDTTGKYMIAKKGDPDLVEKIETLRTQPTAKILINAPHLEDSKRDKRLYTKMRSRRHGRMNHSSGSQAAAMGAEHYEHTAHSLAGSDNKIWTQRAIDGKRVQRVAIDEADQPKIRKSIGRYNKLSKSALDRYNRLTYGSTGIFGVRRRGIVSFVDDEALKVRNRGARIGKLEAKQQKLQEAKDSRGARRS